MRPVFHPLPRGARDLGPPETRLRRTLTRRVLMAMASWGYSELSTPYIEYFDVFARGLSEADEARCVRFMEAGSGKIVTLRSDVTPQVARLVAQGRGDVVPEPPLRLCYGADLVRLPERAGGKTEHHQAGLEFIGVADAWADAEVLLVVDQALSGIGLEDYRLDVAHVGVVSEALSTLDLDADGHRLARACLARKDREGLVSLLLDAGVQPGVAQAVSSLCELFGPPKILERARQRLAGLGVDAALDRLEAVLRELELASPEAHARILVDLGEPRGFDYYTGLRIRVWSPGVPEPIARGGRYDELVGAYGSPEPAVGIAFDLEALERAALAQSLEIKGAALPPLTLVVGDEAAATARACADIRARGERACSERGLTRREALERAQAVGAETLIEIQATTQTVLRAASGWNEEKSTQ